MIPKLIHYVWVGSEMPPHIVKLVNQNKVYTPSYQIKIWTEQNMPTLSLFAREAYKKKNWAFVSDYIRFVVLKRYGGVYLDTDQKLLRNIDCLLDRDFFAGWNKSHDYIYTGIIGCSPMNPFIENILNEYENADYDIKRSSPTVLTDCFNKYKNQSDLDIFDYTYFYPVQAGEKDNGNIYPHTYATHLWDESWVKFKSLRKFLRWTGIMKIYHSITHRYFRG